MSLVRFEFRCHPTKPSSLSLCLFLVAFSNLSNEHCPQNHLQVTCQLCQVPSCDSRSHLFFGPSMFGNFLDVPAVLAKIRQTHRSRPLPEHPLAVLGSATAMFNLRVELHVSLIWFEFHGHLTTASRGPYFTTRFSITPYRS